jgi:hypothetical protein
MTTTIGRGENAAYLPFDREDRKTHIPSTMLPRVVPMLAAERETRFSRSTGAHSPGGRRTRSLGRTSPPAPGWAT